MPEVTILYAAFAVVALWLLGELLLQRRAPLHWRALALLGFLVLVAGVTQRSLPLIGVGVVAFGAGQFLATQAVKKGGGATHWSLVAPESVPVVGRLFAGEEQAPASKGRSRRAASRPVEAPEPVAVPLVEPVAGVEAVEATAVFQADEYAVEGDSVYYARTEQDQQQAAYYAYTAEQQVAYADPYADPYAQQPYAGYEQQQYQEYAQYQQHPGQPGQQQYGQEQPGQEQYAGYEQQAYQQQSYDPQQYAQYGAYEQTPYYAADQQQHAPQG